jgi:hypothetical protein
VLVTATKALREPQALEVEFAGLLCSIRQAAQAAAGRG